MATTKNLMDVLRKKVQADPRLEEAVEEDALEVNIAMEIFSRRLACGMTQKQLADRIDSHQSAVARMEDANYSGHSLASLRKIANALDCTLEIKLKPRCDLSMVIVNTKKVAISTANTTADRYSNYSIKSSERWTVETTH